METTIRNIKRECLARRTISCLLIPALIVGSITMFAAPASTKSHKKADSRWKYTNGCTIVPDVTPLSDFTRACNLHDVCYARYSDGSHEYGSNEGGRARCDVVFLGRMYNACKEWVWHEEAGCLLVAHAYFDGVRLFGMPAYYDNNVIY